MSAGALRRAGGDVVCERLTVAETAPARLRGLLGRRALPPGEGLLLRPAGAIHTGFMRFPIDAVFLDRAGTVLAVRHRLPPWRVAGRRGARAVLELAAGEAERLGLAPGDRLLPLRAPTSAGCRRPPARRVRAAP